MEHLALLCGVCVQMVSRFINFWYGPCLLCTLRKQDRGGFF